MRERWQPSHYILVTMVKRNKWNEAPAAAAIKIKIKQILEDLKALQPVRRAARKAGTKILCTHMIIVEKYLASGAFNKMKARLVIDGSSQDLELYPDKSSLTVAIQSVLTILARIPACLEWATITKIDVKGAYVQTTMEEPPVYAKLDPQLTKFTIELYPEYKTFIQEDGMLVIVVQKVCMDAYNQARSRMGKMASRCMCNVQDHQ